MTIPYLPAIHLDDGKDAGAAGPSPHLLRQVEFTPVH